MSDNALQLSLRWEGIADDLMERTAKFPRTARYSLGDRIDHLALDVLEAFVVARYTTGRRRRETLEDCNLRLTRLRVLLRLSYRRQYLSEKGYVFVSEELNEAGKMLGGWLSSANAHDTARVGDGLVRP